MQKCDFLLDRFYAALNKIELKQLERPRSEDTLRRPHDYPYYCTVHFESQVHTIDQFISDPKSKQGEILEFCNKLNIGHTLYW